MHVKRVRVGTPSYHKFKFKVNFQFAIKLSIKFSHSEHIFCSTTTKQIQDSIFYLFYYTCFKHQFLKIKLIGYV